MKLFMQPTSTRRSPLSGANEGEALKAFDVFITITSTGMTLPKLEISCVGSRDSNFQNAISRLLSLKVEQI